MSGVARTSLINCHLPSARPLLREDRLFAQPMATLRLWRWRIRERRVLARLTERELADFGASTADVYRELFSPFWRGAQPPC
jgi:uncharacterized protein YjiS (DUF1127 family)